MLPVSVWGTEVDEDCPLGSAWFFVWALMIDKNSRIYAQYSVEMLLPCKEQVLNMWNDGQVEAWPRGRLQMQPVERVGEEELPEGVADRDGIWRTPEEENFSENYDNYEMEEYDSYTHTYTQDEGEEATSPVDWRA